MVYAAQIQCRESCKLLTKGQHPLHFLAESIPELSYIKLYHSANHWIKCFDGFNYILLDGKNSYTPSPSIMFTHTALGHGLLEWDRNKDNHLNASQSQLNVDRPDCSNYFNYKNEGSSNTSCRARMSCKLSTSTSIADPYTFLINHWHTLPECYPQRV